jgi:hypothetical protein
VRSGAETTIVAFGTSMTLFGRYLEHAVPELCARSGNPRIRLVNRGLRGFCTLLAAYRFGADVVPSAPDLLLLEFAHNDLASDAIAAIGPALHGIVAQLRAARPDCEVVFVYLAAPGLAANGPTAAMVEYEAVADHFGFPSIDMATPAEAMVARGEATWSGTTDALTFDNVHHSDVAAERLGRPFAEAFAGLVLSALSVEGPAVAALPSKYAQAAFRPASELLGDGPWALGVPHNHDSRSAEAYSSDVAQPQSADSYLRVRFTGTQLCAWTMGTGVLTIRFARGEFEGAVILASGMKWAFMQLTPTLPPGPYTVEIRRSEGHAVFGDIFVLGVFLDEAVE